MPWIALFLGLGVTAVAAGFVYESTRSRAEYRFEHAIDEARNDIIARLDTYIGYLRAAAGVFAASEEVTRTEWAAFVDQLQLQTYSPGIQGIGFSRRVEPGDELEVLREFRDNGLFDVKLWGANDVTDQDKKDTEPPHAIIYLEPATPRNVAALGYNMYSHPKRREAMARARDEATAIASGRVRLVQELEDKNAQAGFLIYFPVYKSGTPPATRDDRRKDLIGFVYSPYRMDDFVQGVFEDQTNRAVRFDIFDGEIDPANLMHRSESSSPFYQPRYTKAETVNVAGRTWTLNFYSEPRFELEVGRDLTPFTAATGVLLSGAMFVVMRSQVRARMAAERIALELRLSEENLRVSEARFRRLAESNLIGVVFLDVYGRIHRANLEFFRLTGHDREDVLSGKVRMDTLTPPECRAADAVALAQLRSHGVAEPYEKELLRADGTRVPVLFGMAMLEGSHSECVGFCIDLTESKEAARELQRARDQAESANRAKDQFLAVLSHELRTPLTPVLAVATAAAQDVSLPESARDDFAMIRRNVELEAKLIDDLLDLTKIGRGKISLHVETIDAHQAMRHAIDVCSSEEMSMKRLTLDVDLQAQRHHVRGDAARLQQVFWNLLKNAVKFTPPGGKITVSSRNDAAGRLVVSVTDTGVGIEPALLPKIFDAFEQGDASVARNLGGLGLGLAISKGLVVAHGGTISAFSQGRDRGSTFTVSLETVPMKTSKPEVPPHEPAEQGSRLSILLVEDHADTARALQRLLAASGYQVNSADSVQSALHLAAQIDFDVLVSDLGLPDGDGLELMRQIRTMRNGKPTRGIALTGFGMEEDVAKTREAGFSEHITKPVNFQNLQRAIERVTAG